MSKGKELRLRAWRDFRDSIVDLDDAEKLNSINNFWMLHPFMARTIDPDDPTLWMNPWDMVYHDEVCEYSRAILMHQTALMMVDNIDESYLIYTIDSRQQNDYMLAIVDGKVMNYGMNLVDLSTIGDHLNIQNKFRSNKKGVYSLF